MRAFAKSVLVAGLVSVGWIGGLEAQTALVVLGPQTASPELERATRSVTWPHGPVHYADDISGVRASLQSLDATAVLVLPIGRSDDAAAELRAEATDERLHVVASSTLQPLLGTTDLERSIERAATYAIAQLLETGELRTEAPALHRLAGINVTAVREPRQAFATPRPVSVIRSDRIRERSPDNAAELFRQIPGLDVEGVGPNQRRPMIRGLRGQRVLLLEDGLRLNNSRRRLDSGEPPAMVDVFGLDRVEVVRGASSVLYGSDAIGGVVNLIRRRPQRGLSGSEASGSIQYLYGSASDQHRAAGSMTGHIGRLGFEVGAGYRDASGYDAPAGEFGQLVLSRNTPVQDTGVEDFNLGARLEYRFNENHEVLARVERYRALDAGFGFVEPEALGVGGARVQLLWPDLTFDRLVAGYEGRRLDSPVADRLSFKVYRQSNERDFLTNVWIPFDSAAPDGPGVSVESDNFTDIDTYGMRAEASKLLGGRHLLTYGLDLYRDRSFNTDSRTRTILGAGPPNPTTDPTPGLPNATLRSLGAFAQGALALGSITELTLGLRFQDVGSSTRETEHLDEPLTDASERTLVGAANVLVQASDHVNLIGSIGRGFRSPNLIERFFSGDAPDGNGVWERNPDLGPETSLSLDAGARYRSSRVFAEGFVFGNFLKNGIQLRPTGEVLDGSPVFRNVNVSAIEIFGVELTAGVEAATGLVFEAGFTHLSAENPDDPDDRVMEGYRDRLNGRVRYTTGDARLWVEYEVRHSGRTEDIAPGVSPVGDEIPAFTVHGLRGGVRLFGRNRLGIAIENLGNTLYAEPINVAFFRPEPGRALYVSWTTEF